MNQSAMNTTTPLHASSFSSSQTRFAVTHVNRAAAPNAAAAASSEKLVVVMKKQSRILMSPPLTNATSSNNTSVSASTSTPPTTRLLAPRTDVNLHLQRQCLDAEKQQSLDCFVAEHKKFLTHKDTTQEAIAAKMLITESVRFQKVNNSEVLELTLRPTSGLKSVISLGLGCHPCTMKLMLSDVDVIMNNHSLESNGYAAVKKSLGRIPLWGLPAAAAAAAAQ